MIVWLASYPRSGNTFLRVILNKVFEIQTFSIYDDLGDIGADKQTSEIVGHQYLPESFDLETARKEEKQYFIKTHELLDERVNDEDKVIYLIRDGRACSASYTKHQNIYSSKNKQYIDTIYGNASMGSWGEHIRSWDPKNRKNTLIIQFEEFIKDPESFVNVISNYINVAPVNNSIPSFDELKTINSKFFRTGKINAWEDVYGDEEHISFWLNNYSQMKEFGYEYKKPDIFANGNDSLLIRTLSNEITYLMKLTLQQNNSIARINRNERQLNECQKKLKQECDKNKMTLTKVDDLIKEVCTADQVSLFYNPVKKLKLLRNIFKICHQINWENENRTHH